MVTLAKSSNIIFAYTMAAFCMVSHQLYIKLHIVAHNL